MAYRDIMLYPHPALRKICQEVGEIDETILSLLDDMAETMYKAEGIGLAASQVNVHKRAIVLDLGEGGKSNLLELIDPSIVSTSEEEGVFEEGCLSFPELYGPVTRPRDVVIKARDRKGEEFSLEASGLLAVAIQHEIDHLNGVLFIDYLSSFRQASIKRKMRKKYKEKAPVLRIK